MAAKKRSSKTAKKKVNKKTAKKTSKTPKASAAKPAKQAKAVAKKTAAKKKTNKTTGKSSSKKTRSGKQVTTKPRAKKSTTKKPATTAPPVKRLPSDIFIQEFASVVEVIRRDTGEVATVIRDPEILLQFNELIVEDELEGKVVPVTLLGLAPSFYEIPAAKSMRDADVRGGVFFFVYEQAENAIMMHMQFNTKRELTREEMQVLGEFFQTECAGDIGFVLHNAIAEKHDGIAPDFRTGEIYFGQHKNIDDNLPRIYHDPLFYAAYTGHKRQVETAIQNGIDLNACDPYDDYSLLMIAIVRGHMDIARELVHQGVDVTHISRVNGESALSLAVYDDKEFIQLLLDAGARNEGRSKIPEHEGKTPFLWAVSEGNRDMLELLLAHGVDINEVDDRGNSALHLVPVHRPEFVELLCSAGADPGLKNKQGKTAYDSIRDGIQNMDSEDSVQMCVTLVERLREHSSANY